MAPRFTATVAFDGWLYISFGEDRESVSVRALTAEGLAWRCAQLPQRRALWLLGDEEALWNAALLFSSHGTCQVPWVDALFANPEATARKLEKIREDEDRVFTRAAVVRQ